MSQQIFKNQALEIEAHVHEDISGCLDKVIKYTKPDGTSNSWPASIRSNEKGIIYYEIPNDILDTAGDWQFWAYITFPDGGKIPGTVETVTVLEEGEVY